MKEKKIELSKETKKKLEKLGGQINKTMMVMREHDGNGWKWKEYVTKDTGKGREKYESGMVRDIRSGKGRFDLISPFVLKRLADIYERGAMKYEARNWEKGCPLSRFVDSAFRHFYQFLIGISDGEDHLGQCVWNLVAIIHFQELIAVGLMSKELDDLPKYLKKKYENSRNISKRTIYK